MQRSQTTKPTISSANGQTDPGPLSPQEQSPPAQQAKITIANSATLQSLNPDQRKYRATFEHLQQLVIDRELILQSLRYQLGDCIIGALSSPRGLLLFFPRLTTIFTELLIEAGARVFSLKTEKLSRILTKKKLLKIFLQPPYEISSKVPAVVELANSSRYPDTLWNELFKLLADLKYDQILELFDQLARHSLSDRAQFYLAQTLIQEHDPIKGWEFLSKIPQNSLTLEEKKEELLEQCIERLQSLNLFPNVPSEQSGQRVKVATILDTFSEECLKPEFNLIRLKRAQWKEQLLKEQPDFILLESAWQGNSGDWKYLFSKYAKKLKDNPLRELFSFARENNIPTVFWNKEDPVNFEVFIDVAKEADHIFTTAEECIDRYRKIVGHDQVYTLPFAAQPKLHNPITNDQLIFENRACFAGAWRGEKYPGRAEEFSKLLDPLLQSDQLVIYDRYAGHPEQDKWAFPAPYSTVVRGSLPYQLMNLAYRKYALFLNVNSVQNSNTMFSRRVYEILASHTPVISSENVGIRKQLKNCVYLTSSALETKHISTQLLHDPEYRDKAAHRAYREVHLNHTYSVRAKEIIQKVCPERASDTADFPPVTIICVTNRPERQQQAIDSYLCQTYPNKRLIFATNSEEFNLTQLREQLRELPDCELLSFDPSLTLGECLNSIRETLQTEYWAKFDDDDFYAPNYLTDMMIAARYSGAAICGKRCFFVYSEALNKTLLRYPGHEFRYTPMVSGATLFVHHSQTANIAFEAVRRGTDTLFQQQCRHQGRPIFSSDRFNFMLYRGTSPELHTWDIELDKFLKPCQFYANGQQKEGVTI